MINFVVAIFFLFIPPYGWIVTLAMFILTVLYYATGADLLDKEPEPRLIIHISIMEPSKDEQDEQWYALSAQQAEEDGRRNRQR